MKNLALLSFCVFLLNFVKILKATSNESLAEAECDPNESCIRLCCERLSPAFKCSNMSSAPSSVKFTDKFKLLKGNPCDGETFTEEVQWEFLPDGKVVSHSHVEGVAEDFIYPHHTYCIGKLDEIGTEFTLHFCENYDPETMKVEAIIKLYPYFMISSVPFLVLTLLVYSCIKELRNLHGKCLMSYCFSLTLFYLSFPLIQLNNESLSKVGWLCETTGYIAFISVLICFLWLNVMCYDIWSTFRRSCSARGSDRRRFLKYCLYAIGVPLISTTLVYVLDNTTLIPKDYRIGMGETRCFTHDDRHIEAIYVYLPITLVLLANTFFYSITAYKIYQVQKEISAHSKKDSSRHSDVDLDKARFFLYLRLFIVMGVIWILEIISFAFNESVILHFAGILNCLQGISIFFFFIFKQRVKKLIVKRYSSSDWKNSTLSKRRTTSRTDSSTLSRAYNTQMSQIAVSDAKVLAVGRQNSDSDYRF